MGDRILVTGGAGFIGSHLADELLAQGYHVRALDNLSPQVHRSPERPAYLNPEVELVVGDVRDPDSVRAALDGIDAVYHLAAAVGVAQSMYEIVNYTRVNNVGTAVLLEALAKRPVGRLIVASSYSLYGEGMYRSPDGRVVPGRERSLDQLKRRDWEVRNEAGEAMTPVPTPESKPPSTSSVYALTKYDQERMSMMIGQAYGIPCVALRFFIVYGIRQSLSNPYTGVLAIFASRLLNGKPPLIYEDGNQQRDFVNVGDVVKACRLALEVPGAAGQVFNIGSGGRTSILEVARQMCRVLNRPDIEPEISQKYRAGDIRSCLGDITLARQTLGYEPHVPLEQGMGELANWLEGQVTVDRMAEASRELESRRLTI